MTVTTVIANRATFTVDGVDYACQLTGYAHAWSDEGGETIFTACPDGVAKIPDPTAAGVAVGTASLVADWSDAGWAFTLASRFGAVVDCVVVLDTDNPAQARQYAGRVRVPRFADDWVARQVQRMDLALTWTECAGPTRPTP